MSRIPTVRELETEPAPPPKPQSGERAEIIIPSFRPDYVREVQENLQPYSARHFDGTDYPSASKLKNDCIVSCPHEIVILVEDKCRPKPGDIDRILHILRYGFGLVGLYRFGCVGFPKELIRRVGFFDERFIGGGCDDHDWLTRMREANIAAFLSEEVERIDHKARQACSWDGTIAHQWFAEKWGGDPDYLQKVRRYPEEDYGYDLGPGFPDMEFLPWKRSWADTNTLHHILLA